MILYTHEKHALHLAFPLLPIIIYPITPQKNIINPKANTQPITDLLIKFIPNKHNSKQIYLHHQL